jgi:hypothetical protein
MPGVETHGARAYWRETLGDKFYFVDSMNDVASAIRDTVKFAPKQTHPNVVTTTDVDTTSTSSHVNIVL